MNEKIKGWSGIETSDGQDLLLYATCEGNWHGRICFNKMEDAEFIALARNAFDVMMRRGWNPYRISGRCHINSGNDGCCMGRFEEWLRDMSWDDPFTALVEADKWYKENVDKKNSEAT